MSVGIKDNNGYFTPPFPTKWGTTIKDLIPPHLDPVQQHAIPQRQIRAVFDDKHVIVFQAYNKEIAEAAVRQQRLNASPLFKMERMTWVKPSYCWAMYRSGYASKDRNQERILALRIKHEDFAELLSYGVVNEQKVKLRGIPNGSRVTIPYKTKTDEVRIQWDPERDAFLNQLPFQSIQIGIPVKLVEKFVKKWVVEIEDVTNGPHQIKESQEMWPNWNSIESLRWCIWSGYLPQERVYDDMLPRGIRKRLEMED